MPDEHSSAEPEAIDPGIYCLCVQLFNDAEDMAALMLQGQRLAADKLVNQVTKDVLRGEFERNQQRLRAASRNRNATA